MCSGIQQVVLNKRETVHCEENSKGELIQAYKEVTDRKDSRKESGIRVAHKLVLDMLELCNRKQDNRIVPGEHSKILVTCSRKDHEKVNVWHTEEKET